MNDKISTLLDGELERSEAMAAIRHLGSDAARRAVWESYHLIGDVMRGESADEITRRHRSAEAIFARLASEPTVIAPAAMKMLSGQSKTRMALAMAASVVTISAIAVVAMKQQSGVVAPVQAVRQMPLSVPAGTVAPDNARVNDYLAIHRQFSNPQAFQAVAARREIPRAATGQ